MTMTLVLVGSLLTFSAVQDDGKKELEKIQGTWVATTYDVFDENGPKLLADDVKTIKFICKDDTYVQWIKGKEVEKGTHKLDPSKSPKHMDIAVTEGMAKGLTQLAIYEIDGDTLKICANFPGNQERPKEFVAKAGSGTINIVLMREKK